MPHPVLPGRSFRSEVWALNSAGWIWSHRVGWNQTLPPLSCATTGKKLASSFAKRGDQEPTLQDCGQGFMKLFMQSAITMTDETIFLARKWEYWRATKGTAGGVSKGSTWYPAGSQLRFRSFHQVGPGKIRISLSQLRLPLRRPDRAEITLGESFGLSRGCLRSALRPGNTPRPPWRALETSSCFV